MATLAQLEKALVNADKAGDMDAARKLAVVVKNERARLGDTLLIPGTADFGDVPGTVPEKKSAPLEVSDALGPAEAGLSIGSSIVAPVIGAAAGVGRGLYDLATGAKAKPGEDSAADTADKVTNALTYQPRTNVGKDIVNTVGAIAEPLSQLDPMMAPQLPALSEVAMASKPTARIAVAAGDAAAAIKQGAAKVVDPVKQAAIALTDKVTEAIAPGSSVKAVTPGTGVDAGAAAADLATVRRANAEELGFTGDKALTEGQASRDFQQQRFERETAKQGDIGQPIRDRMQNQNLHLQQKMDEFIDSTGAELSDASDIGGITDKALRSRAARDKVKTRALYKEFENSDEYNHPIDAKPIREMLVSMEDDADLAPVIKKAMTKLDKLAANNYTGKGDGITLKLGEMNELRKSVTAAAKSDIGNKNNLRVASDIKKAIDAATEGKGGELYKKANAAHVQMMSDYENFGLAKQILGLKRGSNDRALALEDLLHKSVISPSASTESVSKLKQLLQTEGETGQQAWKEIQGGMLRHIKDEALKGVSRDSAGNPIVSASGLDRVVTSLDKRGKLEAVLGKKQADKVRLINDVAKDVFTAVPGAVNTSNTATVLAGLIDVAISGTTGIPAPVATVFNQVTSRIKDAKLRARVQQALGEKK